MLGTHAVQKGQVPSARAPVHLAVLCAVVSAATAGLHRTVPKRHHRGPDRVEPRGQLLHRQGVAGVQQRVLPRRQPPGEHLEIPSAVDPHAVDCRTVGLLGDSIDARAHPPLPGGGVGEVDEWLRRATIVDWRARHIPQQPLRVRVEHQVRLQLPVDDEVRVTVDQNRHVGVV